MLHRLLGFAFFLALFGFQKAWSEPYLAAWKGVNCNACHVNQTGGWIRNDFGKNYGNSLQTFDWQGLSDTLQSVKHTTPSYVSVGLDIHQDYTATFNQAPATDQNAFVPLSRMALEINAKANDYISGVITYLVGESSAREIYGLISKLPVDGYVKLGQFTTPYGLELADDNSLVRTPLGFSFDNAPNTGVEAGIYPDPVFVNAAFFNSPTSSTSPTGIEEKAVSGKAGVQFSKITIGGSVYAQDLDLTTQVVRYGTFGWGRIGPVVILGEYDQGYNGPVPTAAPDLTKAYHASAEVDLGSSVYLRLATEWIDDTTKVNGSDGFRHVVSLRCYPVQNFKFQLDLQRYEPASWTLAYTANGPSYYGLLADAFIFY
jgi:hypothetical protein